MNEWTRKNSFIQKLRGKLRNFRIVEYQVEHYYEAALPETTLGGMTGVSTGRGAVIITLKGFWNNAKL